jgi:hypothetical protein
VFSDRRTDECSADRRRITVREATKSYKEGNEEVIDISGSRNNVFLFLGGGFHYEKIGHTRVVGRKEQSE